VVREDLPKLGALLMAKLCEERIRDNMVCGAEVVDAL
jgi:hypothetical protein